ncbi:hypothetical protein IU486_04055 [Streptomyces gardneri]|uniref:hypothetical protein n=1 Tax=Nocardia TaxID=1817 RepID=UPI001359F479|nr:MULTISPECIES: hypothetical protein [Nocardia]MBF6163947.1 hypothetical protein [Streptomyces gardneri]MBF6203523.1 hypothetical protein [Streptomyces gardneri]
MSGGKLRAGIVLAVTVALLVITESSRADSGHRIRNAVNGMRGAHSARVRRRRALRTRGAWSAGPPRRAPVERRMMHAA